MTLLISVDDGLQHGDGQWNEAETATDLYFIGTNAGDPGRIGEIGEYLGFGGQYAPRMAGKEVRAAVAALNVVMAEDEPAAAQGAR
ncbi:hypothetical protein J2R76_003457 [Bradyrhizobium sp. USDA 4532]|uniref:hypothetical protein n=1 Tax=unclassified Bradyrhizobium TaxID=2631580 RepID=UPI00209D8496|nr:MULTISPECIES: hypothetical protein [unclassified Bradyrhizobium]MCP1835121.1 hypothetical protein [Bradyrhizobium sp. USDA 4545]MCP1919866.1 hypothetical protein [Bradyrhizobium sp. USDA 4532]